MPVGTFTFRRTWRCCGRTASALGGSLENATHLGETGAQQRASAIEDEFVRTKILDAIGDLALVGYPVIGHLFVHQLQPRATRVRREDPR